MPSRREFLEISLKAGALLGASGLIPAWALPAREGNVGLTQLGGTRFHLDIDRFPVRIAGRAAEAVGVNGTLPAPLLRFREGEAITIDVTNRLDEDTSIHWHGLLVPYDMDGVPGVSFPGIRPGETFRYRFALPQSGTYWYHSHSGLQEPLGHYGPIVIDPRGTEPVEFDREYVLVLSDWSFESPHRIFKKLKTMGESYNFQRRTLLDLVEDAREDGLGAAVGDRLMWGGMRMDPRDIADVTGATYHYLINGHTTADGWNAVFSPGERVRLRIINASAMTIFNVRIPGLPMTIVGSDGLNLRPVEVDEFQIGVAETYDAIVEPGDAGPFAFVAESIDRYGQVVATLGADPAARADAPELRRVPTLTMRDMGMDHSGMADEMAHDPAREHHAGHHSHGEHASDEEAPGEAPPVVRGVGVMNVNAMPIARVDEPGVGLEGVPHRILRYADLRSLEPNPDGRAPEREIVVHLTGNMERYMWSFDGVKFSEIEGERVRLTLLNHTMMSHPIHLHGMFFELDNGGGMHRPRKHTVVVKPAEKLSVDISADNVGDWAIHCHLLFHMHAGMMQVVSVLPRSRAEVSKPEADEHVGEGHHR